MKFARVIYVLDAFQKKSKRAAKTPQRDIERIKRRLKAAEEHYKRWLSAQQQKEENK